MSERRVKKFRVRAFPVTPLGDARLALVPEEGPEENLRNAQQLVYGWPFLSPTDRAGDEGLEVLKAIGARIDRALSQLATQEPK
jgi:hypothetical protein